MTSYSELTTLPASDWPTYLGERSGLPGPRANLTLVAEAARTANEETIEVLFADGGEYQMVCAAAAIGIHANDSGFLDKAHALSSNEMWRVQEGVIIGLQLLGDNSPQELERIVELWADDPDPFVKRVAVASICEPRLLKVPELATAAIRTCQRTTDFIAGLSKEELKSEAIRKLRQALGYCWSVAIVANPDSGLRAFRDLDTSDANVAWVVKQNLKKKRLSNLL